MNPGGGILGGGKPEGGLERQMGVFRDRGQGSGEGGKVEGEGGSGWETRESGGGRGWREGFTGRGDAGGG